MNEMNELRERTVRMEGMLEVIMENQEANKVRHEEFEKNYDIRVRKIEEVISKAKGGWLAILGVSGMISALVAFVLKYWGSTPKTP